MIILKKFKSIRSLSWFIAILLFTIYLLFGYKYRFVYNVGESMYPNYNHSEWLILERPSKNWRPDRFDVVVFQNGWEKLTKRVIALEGEAVKVEHGKISINGKFLQEPYGDGDMIFYMEEEQERMKKPKHEWLFLNMNLAEIIVPKGYVWVVGDNRSISWYGLCEVDDIVGVSLF